MSGAKQNMQAMQLRANNLANVSTTGFRADLAQARSMQAYGDGLPKPSVQYDERPETTSSRQRDHNGTWFDVTIQGDGWIAVQDKTGAEGFNRNGNLQIDPTGLLLNGNGHWCLVKPVHQLLCRYLWQKLKSVTTVPSQFAHKAHRQMLWKLLTASNLFVQTNQDFKDVNGLFRAKDPNAAYDADANVKILTRALLKAVTSMR